MVLWLGGLTDLDAETFPAAFGDGGRDVRRSRGPADGAIGRVSALAGDAVEVTLVDGCTARYLRREVVPRKLGGARYAQRRAAA